MIKDPVRLTTIESWDKLCCGNYGKIIFFKSVAGGVITLAEVAPKEYLEVQRIHGPKVRKIWSCCNKGGWDRYQVFEPNEVGGTIVTKEEFLEFVKTRTPEYITWLLFNQEWLK
jgi:hypothetical protein